jgi:PEP-CTERM motif-containing protein
MKRIHRFPIASMVIVFVLFGLFVGPRFASADLITRTFDFTASRFPSQAPVDPLFGIFTVSFDPTITSFGGVDDFTSNLGYPGPYDYIFRPLQNSGELAVGNHCDMIGCSAASGSNDVVLDIFGGATSNPSLNSAFYSSTSPPTSVLEASIFTLSFTESIPEPSSLLIFCVGVAGLALFRRKLA